MLLSKKDGLVTLTCDEVTMGVLLMEASHGINSMAQAVGAGGDLKQFYSAIANDLTRLRGDGPKQVHFMIFANNEMAAEMNAERNCATTGAFFYHPESDDLFCIDGTEDEYDEYRNDPEIIELTYAQYAIRKLHERQAAFLKVKNPPAKKRRATADLL